MGVGSSSTKTVWEREARGYGTEDDLQVRPAGSGDGRTWPERKGCRGKARGSELFTPWSPEVPQM